MLIRSPKASDRSAFISLRKRSLKFLVPWEPFTRGGNVPAPGRMFGKLLKTANTPTSRRFFVVLRATGELMGQVSFNQIFRGPFQSAIVGYWIGGEYAGKGYMTEALSLALAKAFGPMKLHRVEANLMPRNAASRGLARAVGMRFEGLALGYLQIAGTWEDHEHWAITAEEWQARNRRPRKPRDARTAKSARTMTRWSRR